MYRKGEVTYQALPPPDRVQRGEAAALADAERVLAYMLPVCRQKPLHV